MAGEAQQQAVAADVLELGPVLLRVLAHLEQWDRLRAALVSPRWHAAALDATAEAGVCIIKARDPAAAEAFVQRRLPRLRALNVKEVTFTGRALSGGRPLLTKLCLSMVTTLSDTLTAVAEHAAALRHLSLERVQWVPLAQLQARTQLAFTYHDEMLPAALQQLCQRLTQLTHLTLSGCDVRDACLHQLSCLAQLRELDVTDNCHLTRARGIVPVLPQLQVLRLARLDAGAGDASELLQAALDRRSGGSGSSSSSSSSSSGAGVLAQLRQLDMTRVWVSKPAVLTALVGLTRLNAAFVSCKQSAAYARALAQLRQLQHLTVSSNNGGPAASSCSLAELRSVLLQLTALTSLSVCGGIVSDEDAAVITAGAAGTASALVGGLAVQGFLRGGVRALLGGVHLPALVMLHIGHCLLVPHVYDALEFCELCAVLPAVAPRLRDLTVCAACSAGKDADVRAIASGLAALSPGLTRLSLNSMWRPPTDEQLRALAQVGTLQELLLAHMSCYASFTDRGIEALTALTSLTCLHMGEMPSNISPELGGAAGGHLTLTARVSPTGYVRKSVSQQLKELCWRCPTFREEYVQELRGELRRTQLELQGSKKDVKAARMEAQGAKQAAKRAQAEVAALRQELEWLRGGVGGAGGAWHGAGSSAGPHP